MFDSVAWPNLVEIRQTVGDSAVSELKSRTTSTLFFTDIEPSIRQKATPASASTCRHLFRHILEFRMCLDVWLNVFKYVQKCVCRHVDPDEDNVVVAEWTY